MELNKIKLLDKTELLQRLRQSGFTAIVDILEDKEINGEKLIELREFEIFKWKLSQPEKRCLWDCIKEIKAKPFILLKNEKPKLPKKSSIGRRSSLSENEKASNSFKGKLESLLGTSAASVGSASTLPNPHKIDNNNGNKNPENSVSRSKPPRPPSLRNGPKENRPETSQKPVLKTIKKAPIPLPEETNNKYGGSGKVRNLKTNSSPKLDFPDTSGTYMDMQAPTYIKKTVEEDGDYLTPSDVSAPATNIKNSSKLHTKNTNLNSFGKRDNVKNASFPPPPPPLPNKNIPNNNINQRNVPNIESQEEEDTYEPPPRIGNAHRTPNFPRSGFKGNQNNNNVSNLRKIPETLAGANSSVINTNKFSIQVITDEPEYNYEVVDNEQKRSLKQFLKEEVESDNIYENPPAVKPKIAPTKYARKTEVNKVNNPSNISESAIETEPIKAKKPTIKDLENIIITNEKETQGAVLSKLRTISSFFKVKRSRDAYENHSISSEVRSSIDMPIKTRPLPETPTETTRQRESRATNSLFLKPFPPPRQIPGSESEYVKLIPNESLPTFTLEQGHVFEQRQTKKENTSPFSTGRGQKTTSIKRGNASSINYESDNKEDEEMPDYENSNNLNIKSRNSSTPLQSEKLILKLAEELRQRNLLNMEESRPISSDVDTDFGDEDDDQPVYDNTPTPNSNISASRAKTNLLPNTFLRKKVLPAINISGDEDDDDHNQPVYDNTPTPNRNISGQRKNNLFPNTAQIKNASPTGNILKVDTKEDDQDQPLYGNSPILTRKTPSTINMSRDDTQGDHDDQDQPVYGNSPILTRKTPSTINMSRVDTQGDHDDQDQPVYGNSPILTRKTPSKRNNLSPNPKGNSTGIASRIDKEGHDDDDDSPSYGNIPETINPLIPNIKTFNGRKNNLNPNSLSSGSKVLPSTSIKSVVNDENFKDAESSTYDTVEEKSRRPIYKWPLPAVPKNNTLKNFHNLDTRSLIPTPPSSDEEDNDDENVTYGNIEDLPPTIKIPSSKINTKALPIKSKKLDKSRNPLPKPPTTLNYEHYMVNEGNQVTVNRDEQADETFDNFIFNLNDEPFYRNTDRKGAKLLLQNLEDGAFLFRPSYSNSIHFLVLTLKYKGKFYNLGIERSSSNKIRLNSEGGSMAPEFSTLKHFVKYFEKEPVSFADNKGEIVEIYLKSVLPSTLF